MSIHEAKTNEDTMISREAFFDSLPSHLSLYEGCGNMLGIVPLTLADYPNDEEGWMADAELRRFLTPWGKSIHSDSVMVLLGDPRKFKEQGYHVKMFVFEPSGDDGSGLGGGISTMCGNGVRAVAAFVREFYPDLETVRIMTMSGLRKITVENGLYVVEMGELANSAEDLAPYIDTAHVIPNENGRYISSQIPQEVLAGLSKFTNTASWSIGLTGNRESAGGIDGEPHIIIEIPKEEIGSLEQLRELAVAAGPIITKNRELFPLEINANFIVVDGMTPDGKLVIWNCTHERNLGDDPDHSVTAACGTGSTVAGAVMFEKQISGPSQTVLVKCTGGNMEIALNEASRPLNILMKGPANKLKL